MPRFGRRKGDPQPTQPASVLLASTGESAIPDAAIGAAVAAAAGEAVAVVTIARVYGSSLGLPNPGLMPTRAELAAQRKSIEAVVSAIERRGVRAWGQIAVTRHASRTIARAAKARGAQRVIVVRPEQPRWRRVVEGDVVREVSRRLGPDVVVEAFPTSPVSR
jgi:hypothetical protein